jgi:hypothetical protein
MVSVIDTVPIVYAVLVEKANRFHLRRASPKGNPGNQWNGDRDIYVDDRMPEGLGLTDIIRNTGRREIRSWS